MTTLPRAQLQVSFILSTRNRREVVLDTIENVLRCGIDRDAFEILVVDNASADGTADAIEALSHPNLKLFRQSSNLGSCAKNVALAEAQGRFVIFLDDDSYPQRGCVARMIHHFDEQPDLGAAVFTVELPDGSRECSAYPDVFIGCGTGFRRVALTHVGGLPDDFFMQAEEYDLSLRLLDAGWRVRSFDDIAVTHLKSPAARRSRRTTRLDVRNNLVLATRYFPEPWVKPFAVDWMKRYYKIAAARRQRVAFFAGALQGFAAMMRPDHRRPIRAETFEEFAKVGEIERRLRIAQEILDLQSVAFIDLGKNILPFWLAARNLGIDVIAIADNKLARAEGRRARKYRGVPILCDGVAHTYAFDAAVVSNVSPVHARERLIEWRGFEGRPVIDLFEPNTPWAEELATDSLRAAAA